jgi:Tfp pilus assembly protein PilF
MALDDASGTAAGVAGGSLTKEKERDPSEDGNTTEVPKTTVNKRSRKPSRGRSKKRQRTLDLEVSAHLLLQIQADRRLLVDTGTGIHSTVSVAPSSLRHIRHD